MKTRPTKRRTFESSLAPQLHATTSGLLSYLETVIDKVKQAEPSRRVLSLSLSLAAQENANQSSKKHSNTSCVLRQSVYHMIAGLEEKTVIK